MLRLPSVKPSVPSVDAESADYSALNIQHLLSVNVESLSSNKKI